MIVLNLEKSPQDEILTFQLENIPSSTLLVEGTIRNFS